MVQWRYFPSIQKPSKHIFDIIDAFNADHASFDSDMHSLESDCVLKKVMPHLVKLNYDVEKSKKAIDKVRIPVLFGENGKEELAFEADAYSTITKTVIEVEAGRGVTNFQFLKDFFQACMMNDVEYFCVAIRKTYNKNKDYEKVCNFFQTMYSSNKLKTQLKGIIIIGY